jgi:hypothetical protein
VSVARPRDYYGFMTVGFPCFSVQQKSYRNHIYANMAPQIEMQSNQCEIEDYKVQHLLQFYGLALNAPGSPPGPSAPAAEAAAAVTVTPAVAALVRVHFRQSHQIHWTGRLHGY